MMLIELTPLVGQRGIVVSGWVLGWRARSRGKMVQDCRRRSLLRFGGAAALGSLAGCATIQAELGLRTERLGRVVLANSINQPFEVDVEVYRDDERIYASSHHLDPGSAEEQAQVVLNEWAENNAARSWEIRAQTDGSGWRNAEIDAAVGEPDDCHSVKIVTGDWPETPLLVLLGDCTGTENGDPIDR